MVSTCLQMNYSLKDAVAPCLIGALFRKVYPDEYCMLWESMICENSTIPLSTNSNRGDNNDIINIVRKVHNDHYDNNKDFNNKHNHKSTVNLKKKIELMVKFNTTFKNSNTLTSNYRKRWWTICTQFYEVCSQHQIMKIKLNPKMSNGVRLTCACSQNFYILKSVFFNRRRKSSFHINSVYLTKLTKRLTKFTSYMSYKCFPIISLQKHSNSCY